MKLFKIYRFVFSRLLLHFFVACFVIAILFSCGSFDHLTRVTTEFPRAHLCGECHVEIYKEWSSSPHSKAFSSPEFKAATHGYSFHDCTGCHAPEPVLSESPPMARMIHKGEGVTCVSCHLEEGKLSGPFEASGIVTPHPVGVAPERFKNSRFCGRCHEGTYLQWTKNDIPEKVSCQVCHMPGVTRKITQGTDMLSGLLVSMEKEHDLKRHTFLTVPAGSDSNSDSDTDPGKPYLAVRIFRSRLKTILRIKNNIPHSVPTGDFGVRIVTVKVTSCGDKEELFGSWEMIQELGTALPSGGFKDLPVSIPVDSERVRIIITRSGRNGEGVIELINREVPVESPVEDSVQ